MLAAEELGLNTDSSESQSARLVYGSLLGRHGGLCFSLNERHLTDASALFGEYLAIKIFGKTLLEDDVVIRTLQSLAHDPNGYKVVAVDNGSFLRPSEFNRPYAPGDYQNDAEWPIFSSISQATAEYHGLAPDREIWEKVWKNLQDTQNAEYVRTGTHDLAYDPQRTNHAWNAAIYPLLKERKVIQEARRRITDGDLTELQLVAFYLDSVNRRIGY